MFKSSISIRRLAVIAALGGAFLGIAGGVAQARIFVGVGIPFYGPGFYPPPIYYPPPAYYPPPPVYYQPPPVYYTPAPAAGYTSPQAYAPSPTTPVGPGHSCNAGAYICPMDRPAAVGTACYCLDNRGQRIAGRTN